MANKQIDASSGVPPPVKGSQGDAPPPYLDSGPSGSSAPPPVALPYPVGVDLQPQPDHNGWTPPPNLSVAKSRALRRFWVAFFWAWGIWILIGLFIGGGVSDVKSNPVGRHGHYGKHGQWHDDGFPERQRMGWHKKESHAGSPEETARVEIVEDMVVEVPT